MNKGISFYFERDDKNKVVPPFNLSGRLILGHSERNPSINVVVAIMNDYYSVSAEMQRQMAENTIALCEMMHAEQEIKT